MVPWKEILGCWPLPLSLFSSSSCHHEVNRPPLHASALTHCLSVNGDLKPRLETNLSFMEADFLGRPARVTESRLTQTASQCHADEELVPRGLLNPFSCFLFSPEGMKTSKVATT